MARRTRTPMGEAGLCSALERALFEPVDIASLVVTRIAFGLLMAWEAYHYLASGMVDAIWIEPSFHFAFPGFAWLAPWPGDGMHWHLLALLVLGLLMAAGALYRAAAALHTLGFLYLFLLEQSHYLNHAYLIALLSFLMTLLPAHRALSVDAWLRPKLRTETIPAWPVWVLRGQMGLVYFFGGVAKLNADWLRGYPLRQWLPGRGDAPILGPLYEQAWMALAMSWSGLLIDLLAFPALLWRRTRLPAFLVLVAFHLWNSQIFDIGVFPWLAIACTLPFFAPDWPRRVFHWPRRAALALAAPADRTRRVLTALFLAWFALQVLVPLRHVLYPGPPQWTEQGHRFAWRMKLRSKIGMISFFLTDPETGRVWRVDPAATLSERQLKVLAGNPMMIQQYAHHLSDLATEPGKRRVEVRAAALASLNGREPQPIVDHRVNLAGEPLRVFANAPWILPLEGVAGDWNPENASSAERVSD